MKRKEVTRGCEATAPQVPFHVEGPRDEPGVPGACRKKEALGQ